MISRPAGGCSPYRMDSHQADFPSWIGLPDPAACRSWPAARVCHYGEPAAQGMQSVRVGQLPISHGSTFRSEVITS